MRNTLWSVSQAGLIILSLAIATCKAEDKNTPAGKACTASAPAATAPHPSPDTILVRIGDKTAITQGEFDEAARGLPPAEFDGFKVWITKMLVDKRHLALYADDHPGLVKQEEIDKEISKALAREKAKDLDELDAKLKKVGRSLKQGLEELKVQFAQLALLARGSDKAKDEAVLKKMYETEHAVWADERVKLRQLRVTTAPYETEEQLKEHWKPLAEMRDDIRSGKRTWEQCVADARQKLQVGEHDLGLVPRHLECPEPMAEAAFALKPGEVALVATDQGYHLIQAGERRPAWKPFQEAKHGITTWLKYQEVINAMTESRAKYPAVGVREPALPPPPPPPPTQPAPTTKPVRKAAPPPRSTGTRPASRPAPVRKAGPANAPKP